MSHRTAKALALGGLLAIAIAIPAQESGSVRMTPATLLKEGQPRADKFFPFGSNRDALVYVRFNLTDKGEVIDPEVDDGGFHSEEFARAALRIAAALKFSPAKVDGQPVESRGLKIPIRFSMSSREGGPIKGVTKEFRAEALKVQKLIQEKDFAGAEHHANYMMAEKVALNYEFAVLQSTLADTYARMGQYHLALAAVRQVTGRVGMNAATYTPGGALPKVTERDYLLPLATMGQLLRLRFVLDDSQGFYWDAVQAHAELQAIGQVVAEDPTMKRFQELTQLLQSAPSLKAHIRIGQNPWIHGLMFRRFTVTNVRGGTLRTISLGCAGAGRKIEYRPDLEWSIPDKFGRCGVSFEADAGTEFDLVEFRDAATALPQASLPAAAR